MRDPHFFIDNNSTLSVAISSRDTYKNRQNIIYKLIVKNYCPFILKEFPQKLLQNYCPAKAG